MYRKPKNNLFYLKKLYLTKLIERSYCLAPFYFMYAIIPLVTVWIHLTSMGTTVAHTLPYLCIVIKSKTIMATILSTDVIFATVTRRGRTIASLSLSGVTSLAQIINHIRSLVSDTMGILTLSLRNSTQGWRQERNIILKPHCRATQLSLF